MRAGRRSKVADVHHETGPPSRATRAPRRTASDPQQVNDGAAQEHFDAPYQPAVILDSAYGGIHVDQAIALADQRRQGACAEDAQEGQDARGSGGHDIVGEPAQVPEPGAAGVTTVVTPDWTPINPAGH